MPKKKEKPEAKPKIGERFILYPDFRAFYRDLLADLVLIAAESAWNVGKTEDEVFKDIGLSLGSKRDVIMVINGLVQRLAPTPIEAFRIYQGLKIGKYEGFGGRPR